MSKRKQRRIKVATPEETDRYAAAVEAGAGTDLAAESRPPIPESSLPETGPLEPAVAEAADPAKEIPADPLDALRRQLAEAGDKHLRAVAELQNFRRRATAEKQDTLRYAAADLIRAVLTVVDDFERTLAAVPPGEASSFVEGVQLVHDNLLRALAAHHVERIKAAGETFDPTLHEAIMQQTSPDQPAGTVLQEVQAGYKLWDRVLRPAKVIVSASADRGDQPATAEQNAEPGQPQGQANAEAPDGSPNSGQELD